MSAIRRAAEDYLRMRRALGYKLEIQGWMLDGFVAYLEQAGARTVTIEHAVAWATLPAQADPTYWSDRLSVARQFARHLQTIDPACEVPPTRLLPSRRRRAIPYLYTQQEIVALMCAAGQLRGPLHAATHQTLIGLMAVTGMRLGEAIGLDREDVDERHRLLRIIDSKFGKSREVALHDGAMDAMNAYRQLREELCPRLGCEAFFVSTAGTRLFASCVHRVFGRLVSTVGLQPRSPRCRPRMHDIRHSFAVRTLLDWHATGADVQARLPSLSTYMGHVNPASTYYYLTAAPELLALVARRLEPAPEGPS
ncbi:MAG: tyrosine-type recombinase/integrase [Solirubrobacteraceae bacterium]